MPFDLLVFDLDGTLIDTRDGIVETTRLTLAEAGFEAPSPEAILPLIGLPLTTVFHQLLPAGVDSALVTRLVESYRARYRQDVIPNTRAFPDVAETLDICRGRGMRLAVATSKTVRIAGDSLEVASLAGAFELVLGVDSVSRPKPAPDMVLAVLERLGCRAERTLVVGDTIHDVEMGRSAGCETCAVTYGVQSRTELEAAAPDHFVERFGELLRIVGRAD